MDDYDTFKIHQFDISTMVKNPAIYINGKRGSGKTVLIQSILKEHGIIPDLVFDPAERAFPNYSKFVPSENIITTKDINIIVDKLQKIVADAITDAENRCHRNRFIIFEQTGRSHGIDYAQLFKKDIFIELLYNARRYHIGFCVMTQCATDYITYHLTSQADYIFLIKESSSIERKRMCKKYYGSDNKILNELLDSNTVNYQTLVINHRSRCKKGNRSMINN